ncbi:DUF308 domain-containing protein [Candidatus Saccharibacteria bacterium]|nr:DUF308 domain-containing protein [Candidatus Saccharibacteria bacterium]
MAAKASGELEALRFLTITRGVVSVLFGIMALIWPGLTIASLAVLVTIWLLVSGVINVVRGVMGIGKGSGWVFTLILAVLQIGIGAYLIQRPGLTIATFVALIAIALVVEGVIAIVMPLVDSKDFSSGDKTLTIFYGIFAFLAGIGIWRYPVAGSLAFVWILGLFALITGPLWIAMGVQIKD